MEALFHTYGFSVDAKSDLHVKITTNALKDICLSNPAYGMQTHFIRISIYHSEQEYYRIQYNKNSASVFITLNKNTTAFNTIKIALLL